MPEQFPPQLEPILQALPPQGDAFFLQAYEIWLAGGWAMIAIAGVALIMFTVGMNTYFKLLGKRFELSWRSAVMTAALIATAYIVLSYLSIAQTDTPPNAEVSDAMIRTALIGLVLGTAAACIRLAFSYFWVRGCGGWQAWLDKPSQRRGPIGEILEFVSGTRSVKQTAVVFEELRSTEVKPFLRDLMIMRVCVAAAPLLGLLGTVTGMIATFEGLRVGSGGDKTKDMVASGISEALITTETGLIIALAGLFFQYQLSRKQQRYKAFLAHMETVCNQRVYKQNKTINKQTTTDQAGDGQQGGDPIGGTPRLQPA